MRFSLFTTVPKSVLYKCSGYSYFDMGLIYPVFNTLFLDDTSQVKFTAYPKLGIAFYIHEGAIEQRAK